MPSSSIMPVTTGVHPITLPAVTDVTGPMLTSLTAALGVGRSILASDEQINHAWANLPRLLSRISPEHRTETVVRMCVAVATGLFDSAVNYAWNAAVVELRNKVRRFGISVVPQVTGKSDFDEDELTDLKDAELLQLCLRLNLISEDGYVFLDQCRDIRNNFSAAHPSMGALDEDEFLTFLNRVAKHALSNEQNPRGVDIQAFIGSIKGGRFTDTQFDTWQSRIAATFDAQRELLFGTLHGIYCDAASGEEARVNALRICEAFAPSFTPKTKSDLVDRHQNYRAKGDEVRHTASRQFFERLGMLALLGDSELHSVIISASRSLMTVHDAYNNFYNEPPFAERLSGLVAQNRVPESAQHEFVETVVTCATGNRYGVSTLAMGAYWKMIRSFSPAEVQIMLELPRKSNTLAARVKSYASCRGRYKKLVSLLDVSSVPTKARADYDAWLAD